MGRTFSTCIALYPPVGPLRRHHLLVMRGDPFVASQKVIVGLNP